MKITLNFVRFFVKAQNDRGGAKNDRADRKALSPAVILEGANATEGSPSISTTRGILRS